MCGATPSAQLLLPSTSSSAAVAREWARRSGCAEHTLSLHDDVLLLISELITNSVLHGGPPIVLALECDEQVLRVRVRDGSTTMPPGATPSDPDDESGRGISLVDLLTDTWGVQPVEDEHGPGKEIWFELRTSA